jgi:hypothetical protein
MLKAASQQPPPATTKPLSSDLFTTHKASCTDLSISAVINSFAPLTMILK